MEMNKQKYLKEIEAVIAAGPYKDDWDSLCEHPIPSWYRKDKFGIFIHWGIYSVPAYGNEWYARNVYRKNSAEYEYHVEKYGTLDTFGYKDLIPLFKGEKFCAEEWAKLIKMSGARYVVPVAEHHDGFQMYDSDISEWNSARMGPNRDVLGELQTAFEKEELTFCASSHRAEHWWFFNHGRDIPQADVNNPKYEGIYGPAAGTTHCWGNIYDNPPDQDFLEDWLIRTCEIVDKYQPKMLYFDWWIEQFAFKPYLKKFAAYYYNKAVEWGEEVAIAAKHDAFVYGSAVRDIERGKLKEIQPVFWQTDTSAAINSWGYTVGNEYKKASGIVCDLVDIVSKNGALLLNIGPKSDGSIPEEDKRILLEIGNWLKINGEAIYDTRCWKIYGEGITETEEGFFTESAISTLYTSSDIRFTCKGNVIYAIVLKWPESGVVHIKSIGNEYRYLKSTIRNVEILGSKILPAYGFSKELSVEAKWIEPGDMPVVIKITID